MNAHNLTTIRQSPFVQSASKSDDKRIFVRYHWDKLERAFLMSPDSSSTAWWSGLNANCFVNPMNPSVRGKLKKLEEKKRGKLEAKAENVINEAFVAVEKRVKDSYGMLLDEIERRLQRENAHNLKPQELRTFWEMLKTERGEATKVTEQRNTNTELRQASIPQVESFERLQIREWTPDEIIEEADTLPDKE